MLPRIRRIIEKHAPPPVIHLLARLASLVDAFHFRQISRIRKLIAQRPLILDVETISACNARCVFCAYPTLKRPKEVMSLATFEKIVGEYSEMGGGALSMTPVMGDLLLDPFLLKRYEILKKYPNIEQISFTTNGISLGDYSDTELQVLLEATFLIQFSVGGLDAATYQNLFKVDKFREAWASVERMIALKEKLAARTHLVVAFRTNNPDFEKEHAAELGRLKERGVFVSHIHAYNNYGGEIKSTEIKVIESRFKAKRQTCALPLIFQAAYPDGKVTACGCVDANADALIIGDNAKESLTDIWNGEKRRAVLDSFPRKTLHPLCDSCSAYRPVTYLGSSAFRGLSSRRLPLEFYLRFFGG